ncbi:MAG TPA: hypothetical protein VM120_03935 [Bryobacteraceae bacterium]|nr:hypothetical protein [Bryobacteraceae bacterium]
MRVLWSMLALVSYSRGIAAAPKAPDPRVEPVVLSIHPFTGQRGATFSATVRGTGLKGAKAAFVTAGAPVTITTESVEPEPAAEPKGGKSKAPIDLVRLRIEIAADSKAGRYPFRLVTPYGVSNALPLHVTDLPIAAEPAGTHDSPESAIAVSAVPTIFNGRISQRGETDYYSFQAKAGQTLTFQVISGLPQIAAPGSAATIANFDPSLTLYEGGGSWFDASRLKRIAYNDEPVWVFGRVTDAHMQHRFERSGMYFMRIEAFAGQGGPDYGYQLKIVDGAVPQDLPVTEKSWDERGFTRTLSANRLNELAARGGKRPDQTSIETYRAQPVPAAEAPIFKLPGTLDGMLVQPGETHRARFQIDSPRDIAIEVQTPSAAPPYFNPVVRLLNAAGNEVATNIFAGRGACNGALSKSLQTKAIVPLRETGVYTLEVRDATADFGGEAFRYRVQVRPAIPHVGEIRIDTDHINLAPEEAKTIRVVFDREEDYRGAVAVMAELLPVGVQALTGADFEPEKDPPSTVGKRERYTPRTERTVVVLTAASDAAATMQPQIARIVVRPVVDGKLGEPLATKSIPIMVLPKL